MISAPTKKNSLYGVIIKVKNLDMCRSFYRDVLRLGHPTIDSNFWVEFTLQDDAAVVLEQAFDVEPFPEPIGRTSWLYKVENLDEMIGHMSMLGHEEIKSEQEKLGYRVHVFKDPEGNLIHLFSGRDD